MKRDEQLLDRLATDLRLAGKVERTVEAYTGAVRRLARVCSRPLTAMDENDVRTYLVGMVRDRVARGTFSINLCGVRLFFRKTLTREVRATAKNPVDRLMERPKPTRRS